MVVGQIVAISFAQNLFFATILVSKGRLSGLDNDSDHHAWTWTPSLLLELIPIAISLLSTVLVPYTAHTNHFMLLLLIPHLLLFVPAMLRPCRSSESNCAGSDAGAVDAATKRYVIFFRWIFACSLLVQAVSTVSVVSDVVGTVDGAGSCEAVVRALLGAIYEHPAVSSVSWDVIFCTVGATTWYFVHGGDLYNVLGGRQTRSTTGEKKDE
jgi:hypothetical protein